MAKSTAARPTEPAEVREEIVRALRLDLVGPWAGHPLADERLPGWVRPSNWYLTGFLVPRGAPVGHRADADVDDEPEVAGEAGLGDDSTEDRRAAKKGFFPSSMGLSFLVREEVEVMDVLVRWGDYRRVEAEGGDPNGSRDERDDRAGAGGGRRDTSGGRNGDGTGDEVRGDDKAETGVDGTDPSRVRSWWQRTPRTETVRVTLPATAGGPRPPTRPELGRAGPSRGRTSGGRRELRGPNRTGYALRVPVPGERPHRGAGSRAGRGVRLSGRNRGTERDSVRPASRPPRCLRR